MIEFTQKLVCMNKSKGWNYVIATCGETIDLDSIEHNHCIDDRLIVRFGYKSKKLMDFLGAEIIYNRNPSFLFYAEDAIYLEDNLYAIIKKNNKDKGQRIACGCMKSKDIGEYNTCPHLCEYCYANTSKELAVANWQQHQLNKNKDTITGL